jgi:hypothetical protein
MYVLIWALNNDNNNNTISEIILKKTELDAQLLYSVEELILVSDHFSKTLKPPTPLEEEVLVTVKISLDLINKE